MSRRVIRWEDPPHSKNVGNRGGRPPGSEWNAVAETLRYEPKRWAVIFEGPRTPAFSVRNLVAEGRIACFRPYGDFEAAARSYNGTHTVYARYVGEEMSA